MKRSLLKRFGIFHFCLLILYYVLFIQNYQTLFDSYSEIMPYEHYIWWPIYHSITSFFLAALIIVSILFAFYTNLNKYIIFNCLSSIYNLTDISPFIFYDVPFFYCGMFSCAVLPTLLIVPTLLCIISFITILFKVKPNYKEQSKIKKDIIDLGTSIPHFKLKQVSRKCDVDKNTIIKVVKQMIQNQEIYAEYFNLSKKFVFNISANIEAIDKLMDLYQKWEEEKIGKKTFEFLN